MKRWCCLFPPTVAHFDAVTAAFAEQYRVEVDVTICGHVALSGGHYCLLSRWFHVQAVDRDLDVFGLGHTEDEDELGTLPE